MSKGFLITEETPDREYFTIVPNYIINHSTIWERDLYLFMKRIAGEKGLCFASHQTLARMSGVSRPTISRTIKKLLKRGWIKEVGVRQAKTHPVKEYQVVDLWRMNVEFYKNDKIRKPQNQSLEKIRKPQNQRYVKKHIVEEDPIEEEQHTVEKITKWAYERASTPPSCNKTSFAKSVEIAIKRIGIDPVMSVFRESTNAIQFLKDIKTA